MLPCCWRSCRTIASEPSARSAASTPMSPPKVFSLAVVKGLSKGEVLRTDKKRISVGRAPNNDLVLPDQPISKRHFMVLIDEHRWRIHTFSADSSITVDRRWVHPSTGKRGAIVFASGAELLLYPGDLDDDVIQAEIRKRITTTFEMPSTKDSHVTDVFDKPIEFDSQEVANEPTVSVKVSASRPTMPANPADMDIVEMSQMPTIAGERPPDDLREAARARLLGERAPVAPSVLREADPLENQPVHNAPTGDLWEEKTVGAELADTSAQAALASKPKKRGTWNTARKADRRVETHIPEVIAQPESQIMSLERAGKSSMTAIPDMGSAADAQVITLDAERESGSNRTRRKNAWGDPAEGETKLPVPAAPKKKKNAWGDDGGRKKNAWGDGAEERTPPPGRKSAWGDQPARSQAHALQRKGPQALLTGRQVTIEALLAGGTDPALHMLRDPDGAMATQVRLFGTKIEEFANNLGYRAYMFTSAEPLTGKTTSVLNLALALAEDTNRRVALVEANFRYPRLFEILGVPEKEGIIPVLEGRAQLSESVVKLQDRNLVVLPTGGRHPHPAELLASPRFKTLVAELANTVDIALIDAPSTAPYADTNLLLPLVDAAFLVIAGQSTRSIWVSNALQQIGKKRILGALYNQIPKQTLKGLAKERKQRMKQR